MSKNMWMVRAGRSAFLVQDFEEKNYVAIGWSQLGDLSEVKTKDELEKLCKKAYPDGTAARFRMLFGQIAASDSNSNKGIMRSLTTLNTAIILSAKSFRITNMSLTPLAIIITPTR